MPDQSPPGWVYEVLQNIRDEMTGQHQRMRTDMNAGFDKMELKIDRAGRDLSEKYEAMKLDVERIKTTREVESQYTGRVAAVVAFLVTVLIEGVRMVWHGKP